VRPDRLRTDTREKRGKTRSRKREGDQQEIDLQKSTEVMDGNEEEDSGMDKVGNWQTSGSPKPFAQACHSVPLSQSTIVYIEKSWSDSCWRFRKNI
jgi:hypothetical protein